MRGIFFVLAIFVLLFGCFQPSPVPPIQNNTTSINATNQTSDNQTRENTTIPVLCFDSEPDNDLEIKGTVSIGGKSFVDACASATTVEKYSCVNNGVQSENLSCSESEICSDGICTVVEQPSCVDLDEFNYFLKSEVVAGGQSYADICTSPDTVKEYYCKDNVVRNIIKNCPVGSTCTDGACASLPTICFDSDSGVDEYTFGRVYLNSSGTLSTVYEDGCEDLYTLKEYYCDNSEVKTRRVACISDRGEQCIRGVCQKPRVCEDSDGNNIFIQGRVIVTDHFDLIPRNTTYGDTCADTYTVREYTCSNDRFVVSTARCANGCINGSCR